MGKISFLLKICISLGVLFTLAIIILVINSLTLSCKEGHEHSLRSAE